MYNVAVSHDNHIIAHGTENLNHLREEHPGANVRQFMERPAGLRIGNYLNPEGIVERPRDDEVHLHESIHWNEAVEWAVREKGNAVTALLLEPRDRTKLVAKVFGGLIYNVLLAASNLANRHDLSRWRRLKGSMVSWQEFGTKISWAEAVVHARPLRQSSSVDVDLSFLTNENMEDFFDEDYVYLYNPTTETVELARSPDTTGIASDVPLSADDAHHFVVRNVLGYAQSPFSAVGGVSFLAIADGANSVISNVVPSFTGSVSDYTATTDRSQVYVIINPTYRHTTVKFPFERRVDSSSWRARIDLEVGENRVEVTTLSQDGRDSRTYAITITRTSD